MAQIVPLDAVPNQEITIRLGDNRYIIAVRACNGVMAVSITRDDVVVTKNIRALAAGPLLPYVYMEQGAGNFAFETQDNQEIPDYQLFGITHFLIYTPQDEIDAIRNDTSL